MFDLNTAGERAVDDYVYNPADWIWKWNRTDDPYKERAEYVSYDDEASALVEEAFSKYRKGDRTCMLVGLTAERGVNVGHSV